MAVNADLMHIPLSASFFAMASEMGCTCIPRDAPPLMGHAMSKLHEKQFPLTIKAKQTTMHKNVLHTDIFNF